MEKNSSGQAYSRTATQEILRLKRNLKSTGFFVVTKPVHIISLMNLIQNTHAAS